MSEKTVLKNGVLTSLTMTLDGCNISATRYDAQGRIADELALVIHVPFDLIAAHVALQRMGGTYEKDAVEKALRDAIERIFPKPEVKP